MSAEDDTKPAATDGEDATDVEDAEGEDAEVEDDAELVLPQLPARAPTTATQKADLLGYYLDEVRRHPLLDVEEEKALAVRYRETGDREAAQRLVTANLRLVVKLAFQYHRQWANVLDLIQEGNVGLVEALSRYDPYRGIRFSSYAQYWIRAMILRFLMDNYRMVRLGSTRHGRKLFFQLQKEKDRLERMGITPSTHALSQALDVPESEIVNVDQHLRAPALSLDAPMGEEGRSLTDIVGNEGRGPERAVAAGELGSLVQEKLQAFAETLTDDRERMIWDMRLVAQEPASLSDLGDKYGVSKERIRQIEARIKKRLRMFLEDEIGDEIDFEFDVRDED